MSGAIIPFLSLLVANFVVNLVVFFFSLKLLPPGSPARAFAIISVWLGAFVAYLVVLNRSGLLERWPRALRMLLFCVVAFAGTQVCGISASHAAHVLLAGHY